MSDADKDRLSDFEERWYGSDPNVADTDGDGMNDGDEVELGWSPTKAEPERVRDHRADMDRQWEDLDRSYEDARDMFRDSDADGLDNHTERKLGLDPWNRDTDGDKLDDGLEIELGLDPKDNLPDAPEPAPHVPMRLDQSFSAAVEPATTMTPIESEPQYEMAAADSYAADSYTADSYTADSYTADSYTADSYTADDFGADASVAVDDGGASFADGWLEA